jgi:prepilin signal peptidase PulO-like enzyme (type II secretory pathway)
LLTSYEFFKYGDWFFILRATLGGVFAFSFYAALWAISRGRWIGFGDAKLAIPLGLLLGAVKTFSLIVFSFWIGAVLSLVILFYQRLRCPKSSMVKNGRYFTMKSEIPFAPFLVAAFILVYFFEADVITYTSYAFDFVFKFL